jgi:hypothetical protein
MNSVLIRFLTFDFLITPRIIQWVWLCGAAALVYFAVRLMTFQITLPWYLMIFDTGAVDAINTASLMSGLAILILGNLMWRVMCETLYAACMIQQGNHRRLPE